jgi:hypothetical protein
MITPFFYYVHLSGFDIIGHWALVLSAAEVLVIGHWALVLSAAEVLGIGNYSPASLAFLPSLTYSKPLQIL